MWWHALMWWLIWVGGVLGVLAIGVTIGGERRRRARDYARKAPHAAGHPVDSELCAYCGNPALGYARGYSDERLCHHEDRDCYRQVTVYGSMSLQDERGLYWPAPARYEGSLSPAGYLRGLNDLMSSTTTNVARDPDSPYDPEEDPPWSWREQYADLSPEALEPWRSPRLHYATGLCWCGYRHDDSGPGDTSLAPGPEPYPLPSGMARDFDDPPPLIEHCDLGPLAAWVLDCYERRHREKWAYADHLVAA